MCTQSSTFAKAKQNNSAENIILKSTEPKHPRKNASSALVSRSKQSRNPEASGKSSMANSKQGRLIHLLSRLRGCSIDQLVQDLEWQPHTVRAAISRLRSAGKEVETNKSKQGKTIYRIMSDHSSAGADK
jgi:hypothetical protein